ncbi:DUF2920 family protein [Psychrobacillus sp. PGGUH221]|uniref:DUF2920 family protein n=1 Tax=Psychrobacillus sp. PGGUH221 TaxID=3020058 RepID=UPI0035C736D7
MAENLSIKIPAHHNVYNGSSNREIRIEFSLPENETNENTGIAILVPGFGANIDSNVYKKMRETFADTYNLVMVQCEYFGSEFMQSASSFNLKDDPNELIASLTVSDRNRLNNNFSNLLEILSEKQIILPVIANQEETSEYFNDMGFMQSIDIITAVEAVRILLKENNLKFNEKKVIGYGQSHGAFLIHLSNRLAPHLFSHIIDNSSWIEPVYLSTNRYLFQSYEQMTLQIEFDYLAKKYVEDQKALNLYTLYNDFNNCAKIISFQGNDDNLVNHVDKEKLIQGVSNAEFILVDESKVDHVIYNSNKHGLNADFLNMFEYSIQQLGNFENDIELSSEYELKLSNTKIQVNYSYGLPVFNRELS